MIWQRMCIWLILPVLVLGACSSNTEAPPLEVEMFRAGQKIAAQRRAGKPAERRPLRRSDLDPLEGSFLEVTLERKNLLAYLFVNQDRRDDGPGQVVVWRTEDNVTLTTRNGVLIATRGLGGDILSSTVQVRDGQPGPATSGEHVQMIRSFDDRQVRLALACDLVNLGPEVIEIVEREHATQHLQQRCRGGGGEIVNDYWIDNGNGLVWQSKQWAGPHIGYVRFRRLTTG